MPIWLEVFLLIYISLNVIWLLLMIVDWFKGIGNCQTPSDFMDANGINRGGAICIFTLYILLFPLYNLLLGIVKLIDWLFHIGVKENKG